MAIEVLRITVTGGDLPTLKAFSDREGFALKLVNIGGLGFSESPEPDGDESEFVPGVLVEGVDFRPNPVFGIYVNVTVWAGGSMHVVESDSINTAVVNILRFGSHGVELPKLTFCGRCNRNFVPGLPEVHVGC